MNAQPSNLIRDGEVSFSVHMETGWDSIVREKLTLRIPPEQANDDAEWTLWFWFLKALTQSDNVTVPFNWPSPSDDMETLEAARREWGSLPSHTYKRWQAALIEVDKVPTSDPDLELTEKNSLGQPVSRSGKRSAKPLTDTLLAVTTPPNSNA